MRATELRTPRERSLYTLAAVVSAISWLLLAITIVGAIYGVVIALVVAMAHLLFMAHIKGSGVRVGPNQLPRIWAKVERASAHLGLREPPPTYVVQSNGVLNAFATKVLGRNFIILNSEIVDACERRDGADELDFVVAHEVGHLANGHLSWFLLPARVVPLLGPAYSRACEYTCDACGLDFTRSVELSSSALGILAAGSRLGRTLDFAEFAKQRHDTSGFWMGVYELNSSHPYLCKRVAALANHAAPGTAPNLGRNGFAYPLAPIFSMAMGGAQASAMMSIAIIGVLAAIAIPSFIKYTERAKAHEHARAASVESPAPSGDVVSGQASAWQMKLPGAAWHLLPDAEMHRNNALADRWITRTDLDAHVFVIGEALGGGTIGMDAYAKAVVDNVRRQKSFKLVSQQDVGGSRMIRTTFVANGVPLTYLYLLKITPTTAYQVIAAAPTSALPQVEAELMQALGSFQPR